jgi:hypothetical protein
MHTAMKTMLKTNNSVRHLPLAQLEGRGEGRAFAQQLRNSCTNVRPNYWGRKNEMTNMNLQSLAENEARAKRAANWRRTARPSSPCAASTGLTARLPNGSTRMACRSHSHPFIGFASGQSPAVRAATLRRTARKKNRFSSQHRKQQPIK